MFELDLPRPHTLPDSAIPGCVVAVDAGATKTRARALRLDDGTLSDGQSGSGNSDSVGPERAVKHIADAVVSAAGTCHVAGILLACAATDPTETKAGVAAAFDGSDYVEVVNDVIGAWGSAFGGEDGLALISGTGSHAVGVIGGKAVRVGGWGHLFGDEGSAWQLGRSAISVSLSSKDGRGPATSIPDAISKHFDGLAIDEVVAKLYRSENVKADTAALAQVLDAEARRGDAVANAILEDAARGLVAHIAALARLLPVPEAASVGLVGSTWRSDALTAAFRAGLVAEGGVVATLQAAPVQREPVDGVLALLLQSVGRSSMRSALGW
ncbi:MAG: BadF/BadG/BcrA/BcrD ATPase family protein [Solirubrobacteraceae bacterium]|nr:BadF/BadG/BcrA/BcrD ATPase family protein [Solirubrobacteraceae bacterium]